MFDQNPQPDQYQNDPAELSTALAHVTERRDNLEDSLTAAIREVDAYKQQIASLNATIERLRLHIQQGVEL